MRAISLIITLIFGIGLVLGAASPTLAQSPMATRAQEYRLGSSEKIKLNVFGEESLSGEFQVSGTGELALPLIGSVKVAGMTVAEAQDAIAAALKDGYLVNPKVSIEVLSFGPFYILGEVNRPGEYPYTAGLTVFNAVARAEGFTYRADTRKVFIKRATDGAEVSFPLTTMTQVQPGDTIRIGERRF